MSKRNDDSGPVDPLEVTSAPDALLRAVASAPAIAPPELAATEAPASLSPARDYTELPVVAAEHYVMGPEIARGGMGRIVAARDRRLGREVAVKQLLIGNGWRARFEREARITARLQHPSIVPIYEAGQLPTGEPFYAMKMVAGRSLDKVIAAATTLEERLALLPSVLAVAEALAYAHSHRIIHRDLKPHNVLVGEFGETVVIDWGLAKDLAATEEAEAAPGGPYRDGEGGGSVETVEGDVMGTPAYMPPEQAAGLVVDERADVYALGALLYHLLAGVAPHAGKNLAELLVRAQVHEPTPLRQRQRELPADLLAIVGRAMARARQDRYPTAKELAEDLKRYQTGQLVGTHRYTRGELLWRWVRRWRAVVAVAAVAAVVLGVGGWAGVQRIVRERDLTEVARREVVRQRDEATRTNAALLEEQGRTELLAGNPERAAVFLVEALRLRPATGGSATRELLAEAMRAVEDGVRLVGHTKKIVGVAFSPDDRVVATASADGTARLWDAEDGQLRATLARHTDRVRSVAFSPDGRTLVTASDDKTAMLWDRETLAPRATLVGHTDAVVAAAFDKGGTHVLTRGADRTVRIWPTDGAKPVGRILERSDTLPVTAASFSPDGKRVLTAAADEAHEYDASTGKLLATLKHADDSIRAATYNVDGSQIATADTTATYLWDGRTHRRLGAQQGQDGPFNLLLFSSGSTLVFGAGRGGATVWDGAKWTVRLEHGADVVAAAFQPGQRTELVTTAVDGTVRRWGGPSLSRPKRVLHGHGDVVGAVAFSAKGDRFVTGGFDGVARIWTDRDAAAKEASAHGSRASFAPDGRIVFIDGEEKVGLRAHVEMTRSVGLEAADDLDFAQARVSPDGQRLLGVTTDGTVVVWSAAGGRRLFQFDAHTDGVLSAAFGPRAEHIVTSGRDGTVRLWRGDTGAAVRTLDGSAGPVPTAAFSPDGRWLVSAHKANLQLWSVPDGAALRTLEGHTFNVSSVAVSPDGALIASGSFDTTLKLWDARSGTLLRVLVGHGTAIRAVAFSPDGSRLYSGGDDGTLRVWEVATGRMLAQHRVSHEKVLSVDVHPAGTHVLTSTTTGWEVALWDVRPEPRSVDELHRVLEQRVPWRLVDGTLVRR